MTAKRLFSLGVRGTNQGSETSILTEKDFVKEYIDFKMILT